MCKHEDKKCPRCQATFECKVGDISNCQCYLAKLNDGERDFLQRQYSDCLCANCMKALRAQYNQAQQEIQWKQVFGQR